LLRCADEVTDSRCEQLALPEKEFTGIGQLVLIRIVAGANRLVVVKLIGVVVMIKTSVRKVLT
jgi:hypothetical protein